MRAATLEILFTAAMEGIRKAEQDVKSIGERIERKPIKAKLDADAKGALAGIERVETAAKKLVSNQTALKLDADISRAEKSFDRAKQRLADLEVRALGGLDVGADVKRAEAALAKVERNLKGLTGARQMIEVDATTVLADEAIDALQGRASDGMGAAGEDSGAKFGRNLLAALAAIPIAGAVIAIGKAAGEGLFEAFQEGLEQPVQRDRLQGLTGISEAEAARLGMVAGEAYANVFGESVEANMDTARLALQFDIIDPDSSQRDSQRVIEGLAGIADVMGEEIQPVARATATLLRTGLARSAQEAFDIIAAGQREGVNIAEDLLDTIDEYSTQFRKLGIDGPQSIGLLRQAIQAGARDSDIAADALKEFAIFATDPAYAETFEAVGFSWDDLNRRITAGGPEAAAALDETLDRLRAMPDPAERSAAAIALFGTKAEDMGDALYAMDLSTAVEQMNGVEGAAARMFATLSSNDATTIEQAQRNIEVAADAIKGALAAALSEPTADFAEWVSRNRGPLTEFLLDLANGALELGRGLVIAASDGTVAFGEFVAGPLADTVDGIAGMIDVLNGFEGRPAELDELAESMRGFDESTAETAQTMRDTLIPEIDNAQARMNEWAEPIVHMGYLNDASLRLADSIGAVGVAGDGLTLSLAGVDLANLNATQSGSMLEGQIRGALIALDEEVAAAARAGESQTELAGRYNAARDALSAQLQTMGLTEEQANSLIDTVLRTPESASTEYSSNARAEQGRVQDLASRITTLPDGSVVITADTGPAIGAIGSFINAYNGRRIRVYVDATGGQSYQVAGTNVRFNRDGALLEFMAAGGVRGLSPMQPIAQMVPPSTWRVVGDRSDVAEAYIPLDRSPRSMAILAEVIRRMGGEPMAGGGIVPGGPPRPGGGSFTGRLVLDSGQFLGIVDGRIDERDERDALEVRQGVR